MRTFLPRHSLQNSIHSSLLSSTTSENSSNNVRIEDRDVPEGHKGLHDDLYGDGESHEVESPSVLDKAPQSAPPDPVFADDGSLFPAVPMGMGLKDTRVAAAYAVFNGKVDRTNPWKQCEFIGMTRNLDKSLSSHLEEYPEKNGRVSYVMAVSFLFPRRNSMQAIIDRWTDTLKQEGGGVFMSEDKGEKFKETIGSTSSAQKDESYSEKKRKMRKAIADATLVDELEEQDREMSEKKMRRAVEMAQGNLYDLDDDDDDDEDEFETEDDWSKEIQQQTDETKQKPLTKQVVSPFAQSAEAEGSSEKGASSIPFTVFNVDKVLDEVRPYLIGDGGNVAVSAVNPDTMSVDLILEGACGSCPSSTVTMKMGIERVLKENWGNLGEVRQVQSSFEAKFTKEVLYESVELGLKQLEGAIKAMGGSVSLVEVSDAGVVKLNFTGSEKVRYGLELAIADIELVTRVVFEE